MKKIFNELDYKLYKNEFDTGNFKTKKAVMIKIYNSIFEDVLIIAEDFSFYTMYTKRILFYLVTKPKALQIRLIRYMGRNITNNGNLPLYLQATLVKP